MGDKLLKNKKLIITAAIMLIVIVILVVVIILLNNNSESKKDENISNTGKSSEITSVPDPTLTEPDSEIKNTQEDNKTDNDEKQPEAIPADSEDTLKEIKLGEYKGLKAEYASVEITDEDIQQSLKQLQNENVSILQMPADKTFENGDMAILTYEGRVDGIRIDELYVPYVQIDIGAGMIPKEMEEKIIGNHIGDVVRLSIDYPADYTGIEGIAGKTVDFIVELVDGFVYSVPDVDDSFIKGNSEYSTVEEYKTKEKERLQAEADKKSEEDLLYSLKKQVVDNSEFPDSIETEAKKTYVKQYEKENQQMLEQYYITVDEYYQMVFGYAQGEYSAELLESIEYDTKYTYALDEIVKKEGIEVSNAEIEDYLLNTYIGEKGYSSKDEAFASAGEQTVINEIRRILSRQKADELVYNSAIITR